MVKLETWLNPAKPIDEPVQVAVSERYIDPETGEPALWTLVPLTAARAERIQAQCIESVLNPKTGGQSKELNGIKYLNGLAAETVKDPNLRDKKLQEAFGTSDAVSTLNEMLTLEEKNRLTEEINKIYRLNPAALEDMIEDAKNE